MSKCKFENCDEEAVFAILGVCKTCYSGLRYWRGRPRSHKLARQRQLRKLNSRMEFMIDSPHSMPRPRKTKKKKPKRRSR